MYKEFQGDVVASPNPLKLSRNRGRIMDQYRSLCYWTVFAPNSVCVSSENT